MFGAELGYQWSAGNPHAPGLSNLCLFLRHAGFLNLSTVDLLFSSSNYVVILCVADTVITNRHLEAVPNHDVSQSLAYENRTDLISPARMDCTGRAAESGLTQILLLSQPFRHSAPRVIAPDNTRGLYLRPTSTISKVPGFGLGRPVPLGSSSAVGR